VSTHFQLAREALLHGKHVLVEKPLTASVSLAEELVALAQEPQSVLLVGHTFEYKPAVNELRKLVQSGGLGLNKKPVMIKVQAHAHVQPRIEDVAHLDLEFADGMNAHVHVSWLHPCKIRRVTVIGDARMDVYDDTNPAEMIKGYNI
jgi:predicted dehydrogenase